jgi:hypothetical protein
MFNQSTTGDTTMLTKTKIALSVALILGAASAALANDSGENHQDEDRSVVSSVARFNGQTAGGAYGYAAWQIQKQHAAHAQTQMR